MKIKIQNDPRAIWHLDCDKTKCGIMKVTSHVKEHSTAVCLDCGVEVKIPVGASFDVCFEAAAIESCAVCYPEHCTDTSHGKCWCEPTLEGNLIIHNQGA
jgi:hypothetical protein